MANVYKAKIFSCPDYLEDLLRIYAFNNRISMSAIIRYSITKIENEFKNKDINEIKTIIVNSEKTIKAKNRE